MSKKKQKVVHQPNAARNKRVIQYDQSTDTRCLIWIFDAVDVDGDFNFDPKRSDFDAEEIFAKLIHFSKRTWSEIKKDTHDDGRSKHHFLNDARLSPEAEKRISRLNLDDQRDQIFSLSLSNMCRIIGLRDHEYFRVKWFDPKHKFCPSQKK